MVLHPAFSATRRAEAPRDLEPAHQSSGQPHGITLPAGSTDGTQLVAVIPPNLVGPGIAGAPVTDWRHYDTIYTERYMDIPGENSAGYKYSSPLNQAANLEAKLMIVHNIEDDNVLFQNSMQMMDALQQANKPFETMIYPQKNHGVSGPASKHMLQTLTSFFERTLN